jgi:heme exporter protein A
MGAGRPFREEPNIRVEGLCLARGERRLIENLGFEAAPGAFIEVRGGNGAGKTTLLRALAGFVRPRAGRIVFEGVEEPALALHYVGHLNGLKGADSARAHLSYWAGLYSGAIEPEGVFESVGLSRQADLPARVLSQGQARRLALSRLLLAPRPIWLLDEPAAGLDAQGRSMVSALIGAHCAKRGLVIAALHEPLDVTPSLTLKVGA